MIAHLGWAYGERRESVWHIFEMEDGTIVGVENPRRDDGIEYDKLGILAGYVDSWPPGIVYPRSATDEEHDTYIDSIREALRDIL